MSFARRIKYQLLGSVGAGLLRALVSTVRWDFICEEGFTDPYSPACDDDYVLCLWHDVLLMPTVKYRRLRQYTLISRSDDGEIIASIVRSLGWNVIRGSSSRGAVQSLKEMIDVSTQGKQTHVAITADGPRGPRHVLKDGPIYLAARSGLKFVPIGIAHSSCWRARSWDRFIVPKPFSRVVTVCGTPVTLPTELQREDLSAIRDRLQAEMDRVEQKAEDLLAGRQPAEERFSTNQAA